MNTMTKSSDAGPARFIKVGYPMPTQAPKAPVNLTSEQKVQLNRRANEMFNAGLVEEAKRMYVATGYSDGMTRVADGYMKKGQELEALNLYVLAHNHRNSDPLAEKLARIISVIMET
jgi:hypothetical protein